MTRLNLTYIQRLVCKFIFFNLWGLMIDLLEIGDTAHIIFFHNTNVNH